MACVIYMIGLLLLGGAAAWTVDIIHDITIHMNQVISVQFGIHDIVSSSNPRWVVNTDPHIAISSFQEIMSNKTFFNGILNITGIFLGRTKLTFIMTEMGVSNG